MATYIYKYMRLDNNAGFLSEWYNMILYYRNFVPLHLCHNMHYNNKTQTVYKVLFGLAPVKRKKQKQKHITWDFWDLGIKQYICPDVKS